MKSLDSLQEVQLKDGWYNLVRTRDGAGECGPKLASLNQPEDAKSHSDLIEEGPNGLLKKGNWVECSSASMDRGWFRCTQITKFIEIEKDSDGDVIRVLFRTLNSEYEVRVT